MNKKFIFISLIVLSNSLNSFAYYEFDKKLDLAFSSILTLHFTEAELLLQEEKTEKPGNDLRLLYLNYIDFLKAIITDGKTEFEILKKNSSIRLEELNKNKNNSSSPFHLFVESEILIQQALLRIKFNEYIISAGEIRKAYKLIHNNEKLFPRFILNKKISGILNVFVGSVPQQYQWIIKYAGMDGNITDGIKELRTVYLNIESTSFKSYQPEILYYIGSIYSAFSIPVDSFFLSEKILSIINSNPLVAFVFTNILMKQGENEKALDVLNSTLLQESNQSFIYLYYKRGLARLRKLDYTSSQDFEYFLIHYKGVNNIKSAYQKLAWVYLIQGDTIKYKENLRKCIENGVALNEDDKAAKEEAESPEICNVYLLRARLYFDGGYYDHSLSEITGKKIENFSYYSDQLEVTYRLGRIMQMTGKNDKAINYFEMTIKNGLSSRYYFAANSALMLGLIYEEEKQKIKAELYFKKCLSIKHEQYKNSIDQKALAGLDRIKSMN